MKKTIRLTVTSVLALLGALPAKAVAQTAPQAPPVVDQGSTAQTPPPPVVRPRRPYRGLFGGSESGVGANGLGLSVSGFGGYDDNVVADQPGSVGARQPVAGTYGGMNTSLEYRVMKERSRFMAIGGTELRFYEENLAPTSFSQWVDLAATVPLGRRFTFVGTHSAAHSPYYQMGFLPGLPSQEFAGEPAIEPFDVDLGVTAIETYRYDASLRLQQEINRTSELRYEYALSYTDFQEDFGDTHMQRAGVGYTRHVSRYGTLRLGYAYQEGESGFESPQATKLHLLDLGGGYSRPLSFSRRTTVAFSGGTAIVESALASRRYRFVGDASVHHEIGRTWLARAAYERNVGFVEAFPEPFYGSSTRGSLLGLVNRRVELTFEGGYANGHRLSVEEESPYSSVYASTEFRLALTRSMAWYVHYAFNKYTFSQSLDLPASLAPEFERSTVRTGVSLWIPLFTPRTRDATR